jgi:hypothetical protein
MNMPNVAQQWTQDEAIAYESACECITDLIGILMAAVYQEESNATPDSQQLLELDAAVSRSWQTRERLGVHDHSEIARIRNEYGSRIRAWRESADAHRANDASLRDMIQVVMAGT